MSQAIPVPTQSASVDTTSGGRWRDAFLKKTAETPIRSEVRPAKTHPEMDREVVVTWVGSFMAGLARTISVIPMSRRARPRRIRAVSGSCGEWFSQRKGGQKSRDQREAIGHRDGAIGAYSMNGRVHEDPGDAEMEGPCKKNENPCLQSFRAKSGEGYE
jgi:hypothetical protein